MADYTEYSRKMDKTLDVLASDFGSVRAGRANAQVLDRISVPYYGVDTPVGQVASISSPDARTLVIQPWDGSLLKPIEKAIQTSDLGINPQNDGRVIRLVFPQLTEDRRKELTKQVKKYGEDAKVAIRNIRRDAMDAFKKQLKKSEITEDDHKKCEKDLQDMTGKYIKKIDDMCGKKEKEHLLTVDLVCYGVPSPGLYKEWIQDIPQNSILTPHVKELERLIGQCTDSFERLSKARELAIKRQIYIVLKGHFTMICTPTGKTFINTNGSPPAKLKKARYVGVLSKKADKEPAIQKNMWLL